jgi:type IV secretion system protein VirB10
MSEAAIPPAPKADPETLVLRARPPRAIRFRRGVIIAIAAIGSVSLIAVAWLALKPRMFQRVDAREELSQPNARPVSNALNGAPASYGMCRGWVRRCPAISAGRSSSTSRR